MKSCKLSSVNWIFSNFAICVRMCRWLSSFMSYSRFQSVVSGHTNCCCCCTCCWWRWLWWCRPGQSVFLCFYKQVSRFCLYHVTVSNLSYESLELYGIKFAPKKTSYNILCAEFLYRYVNVYMCVCVFYAPSSYIDMWTSTCVYACSIRRVLV